VLPAERMVGLEDRKELQKLATAAREGRGNFEYEMVKAWRSSRTLNAARETDMTVAGEDGPMQRSKSV
jgi:hypothetical protein